MATSILKPSCNGTSSVDALKPGSNCTSGVSASAVQASNGNVHQQGDISEPAGLSSVCVQHINGNVSHDPNNISSGDKKVGESVSTHQNSNVSRDDKKGQPTSTDQNGNASHDDKKKGRHAGIGHKTVLQSDALYQYVLETSVYPRENPYQRELREITEKHPWNLMTTPPDEGQFLMLLMKLINAKNTMELGVYTGYSLLSTALALPDDGKIIAIDINRENYELGAPVLEKAGLSHKIDFREGFILPQLDAMLIEEKNHGFFDFIFVDADKDNYVNYHERLLKLVKLGGLIGYDNTLWNGSLVAPEDAPYPKYVRHYRPFVLELNRVLAGDKRIDISQVPIGDGITLCRRIE